MARKPKPKRPPKEDWNAAAKIFCAIGGFILLWSLVTSWNFRDGFKPKETSKGMEAVRLAGRKAVPGVVIGMVFVIAGLNLKRKAGKA